MQPTECDAFGVRRIDETTARDGTTDRVRRACKLDVMNDADWSALAQRLGEEKEAGRRYDLVFGSNFMHMVPLCVPAAIVWINHSCWC